MGGTFFFPGEFWRLGRCRVCTEGPRLRSYVTLSSFQDLNVNKAPLSNVFWGGGWLRNLCLGSMTLRVSPGTKHPRKIGVLYISALWAWTKSQEKWWFGREKCPQDKWARNCHLKPFSILEVWVQHLSTLTAFVCERLQTASCSFVPKVALVGTVLVPVWQLLSQPTLENEMTEGVLGHLIVVRTLVVTMRVNGVNVFAWMEWMSEAFTCDCQWMCEWIKHA